MTVKELLELVHLCQVLSSRLQMSPPACRPVPRVSDLSNFGSVNTSPPIRSSGQGDLVLVVPRTRTVGFGPRSFSVAGPSLWNTLPSDMKQSSLIFICRTVLQPAKVSYACPQILRMSAAVIILDY